MTRLSGTRLHEEAPGTWSPPGVAQPAALWLESPYLSRAVRIVALRHSLPEEDVADLEQELRIALIETSPNRSVNATWIFQTANHKAADMVRNRVRSSPRGIRAGAPPAAAAEPENEILHLLRAKAALLPPKLKTFYDLRYGQGLSQRDIARRLGACRASVRWLERQCIRLIRRGLGRA